MPECEHCHRTAEADSAALRPDCDGVPSVPPVESEPVRALLARAERERDPARKHALLLEAQSQAPQSLRVAEELLMLGRLYERDGKRLDYTVIKCYLLDPYLRPRDHSPEHAEAAREELFGHPQLLRCLALSDDPDAFLRRYLTRLSGEYIELFLYGSSQVMRRFLGFGSERNAAKYLAVPACDMFIAMRGDSALPPERRALLADCFYEAFARFVKGDTAALDRRLTAAGAPIPTIGGSLA